MQRASLLSPDIQKFMREHQNDDIHALALKKPPGNDWPYALILQQIKARQKAEIKIPLWLERSAGILFPPPEVLEQASSTATARYKASLSKGELFIDLTGGAGVDSWALSESYRRGICIEQDEEAATLLAHNLPRLSEKNVSVRHMCAEDFIAEMPPADLVFVDPARRDKNSKGLYQFNACSPDIMALLPTLLQKAEKIMIKASPMLDIDQGVSELTGVEAVHIIEWRGECKELLFIINPKNAPEAPLITAVSLNDDGVPIQKQSFTKQQERQTACTFSQPLSYLFEPGPAFQKAGGFKSLAQGLNIKKIAPATHLYTAEKDCPDFPGRRFKILGQYPVQKKSCPVKKANLTTRNFPMETEKLKKKLGLKDGGKDYLFACADQNNRHILIHTQKDVECN